ncbi:carbonic anhydrase family protein [Flavisolibacter tropicus]|uniref:Carbonic anhydrase n=1 Tax=Flavisolibacter tropicus TaxID=1492898 RepID=A0A172TYF9_9BACT|nr:carbonic anhydrase family protein [Flavisolibacter tropicus]ANE52115.1 carbonic anhydrase [Flavisolibacter tropicus]
MRKISFYILIAFTLQQVLAACGNTDHKQNNSTAKSELQESSSHAAEVRKKVLTAANQQELTPEKIIQELQDGNQKYQHNQLTLKDDTAMMRETAEGQYPEAFVLSCIDSRIPVEAVFDKGIGDVFVGRVAGNIIDEDILGSMEYACKVAGSKLIVVLGHEACGAVKAAIDGEKLGNITTLLAHIQPAIQETKQVQGEHTTKNSAFVEAVVKENVRNSIEVIRAKSPVLKEMIDKGEIKIIGGYYSLHNGAVSFFNE